MAKSEPSLKIGFVLDGGLERPDGVQQYIIYLSNYFQSLGHQTRFIVGGKVPSKYKNTVSLAKNISVKSNGNKLQIPLFASSSEVRKYLDKEKFDVLHIQTPYSPMMGEQVILNADDSTAVIGTYHIIPGTWYLSVGNWLLGKLCFRSIKRFDKMLSVSEPAADNVKRDFGLDSVILPNVIDYKKFNLAKPQDNKLKVKTILFFGRLVKRKGCLELLKAINILAKSGKDLPPFRVLICGIGPDEAKLKEFARVNNLETVVEFRGFIEEEDKPSVYASSDISVFPSLGGESFGIVLLEALASGKAVVLAGNNVGYASVLEDKPELLFNPQDSQELADLIEYYLVNSDLRRKMAKWGESFTSYFDVGLVGDKILKVYRAALLNRENR